MDGDPASAAPPTRDRILHALLGAGLVLRLLISWAPFSWLATRGPLVDDAFYSFSIARNLARGAALSADGVHATSGFQPLYTLLLAPFHILVPGDAVLPIHLALTLLALCGALTGVFIFRIARRISGRPGALFALTLWTFSPYFLSQGENGLETGLFGLCLAAALDYHLGTVRNDPCPRSLALLGGLLGLTILARVDGLLFAAAVAFDLIRLPSSLREKALRVAVPAGTALALVLPYFLFLRLSFGSFLPESGPATRFVSLCYGTLFVSGPEHLSYFPPDQVPWSYYAGSLRQALRVLGSEPFLFPASPFLALLDRTVWPRLAPSLAALLSGAALLGNLFLLRPRPGEETGPLRSFLRVGGTSAAFWIPAYAFGTLGQWWFQRYFFPLFLLMVPASALLVERLGDGVRVLRRMGRTRFALAASLLPLLVFAVQAPDAFLRHKSNLNVSSFLRMIPILDETLSPGESAGAFQSGTLGYFAGRPVINLDGVVNGGALRAMREGRMADYIRGEGIGAVIDYPLILQSLLVRRSPPGAARALGEWRQAGRYSWVRLPRSGDSP